MHVPTPDRSRYQRHGEPLADDATDVDWIALFLHDLRCNGSCNGPDDTDHLNAGKLSDGLFDKGYEIHRFGVDCTVKGLDPRYTTVHYVDNRLTTGWLYGACGASLLGDVPPAAKRENADKTTCPPCRRIVRVLAWCPAVIAVPLLRGWFRATTPTANRPGLDG